MLYGNEAKVTFMTLETLSPAAIYFYHDIRNPTITNDTHEHKPSARGGNALSTMKTLSTIAKENATKAQVKRSMHNMKMIHVRKSVRYIERVTGVDVTAFLKEKGVEL
mgnify:CR=1 FL=1